ncbi:MAG: endolytic transglycosylase MltG [Deltaproteobacteria bacterium]|nr:MAG: endolytic transglycosylase MltG [Deltaproteobacteria bacterium]
MVIAMSPRRKILYLLIIAMLITGIAFYYSSVSPVNDLTGKKIIDIPKGAGFFRITEILDNAGLVKNRPFFWVLALGKKAARHIRAGEYELNGAMSPSAILDKLVRGEIKVYQVTLPEDITVNEVARRLSAIKLINEKEFMALATDRSFLASLDIEANSIEGYLYPSTYRFDFSMTTKEVIRVLVGQFWREVTPELRKRAQEIGLTLPQWVTLASIIGKYSGNTEEKAIISAIFHNRLKQGMKLQSDPTAIYGLEQNLNHSKEDRKYYRKSDTLYNTYRITGLPPGPIANPDIDSLRAALYPAKVDYLYLVAKKDGSYKFSTRHGTP